MTLKARVLEAKRRAALLEALRTNPGGQFSASALKTMTGGVPKSVVRRLLRDVPSVVIAPSDDAHHVTYAWAEAPRGG